LTVSHSEAITEYIAEFRSRPSSPGAQDGDQSRSTPSKVAPSDSIARRDLRERHEALPHPGELGAEVAGDLGGAGHERVVVGAAVLLGRGGEIGGVPGRQRLKPDQ
jgi:hypothetical protein